MKRSNQRRTAKPSGASWLGEMPAHWTVRRLKTVCSRAGLYGANVSAGAYATDGVRFIRTADITDDGELKAGGVFLPLDLVQHHLLQDGDVLVSRSGTVGRSFLYRASHGRCAYAGYLVRFVLGPDVLPEYVYLFTKTPAFSDFLRTAAISSTIENVNADKYANCSLPVPPLPDQTAIVRVLDHADRRIQRYIRAKEKLIALLEEQKRAVIQEAVAGRVDVRTGKPYPAYKDSGVEWIGMVPAHWKVRRLKFVGTIASGQVDPRLSEHRDKVLIAPNHIASGRGKIERLDTAREQGADSGKYVVRAGDVVYSKIRPHLRKGAIAPVDGLCSADMYPIRVLEDEVKTPYFLHVLLSEEVTRYTVDCSMRVAMPKINRESLGNCWIAYPGLEEQAALLDWIDEANGGIAVLIDKSRREIDFLREYGTRLIADVVTGKLDVREAAAKLQETDPREREDSFDHDAPVAEPSPDEPEAQTAAGVEA